MKSQSPAPHKKSKFRSLKNSLLEEEEEEKKKRPPKSPKYANNLKFGGNLVNSENPKSPDRSEPIKLPLIKRFARNKKKRSPKSLRESGMRSVQKIASGSGTKKDYRNAMKLADKIKTEHGREDRLKAKSQSKVIRPRLNKRPKRNRWLDRAKVRVLGRGVSKELGKNIAMANSKRSEKTRVGYLEKEPLRYYVGRGNNAKLIRELMEKRQWWKFYDIEDPSKIIDVIICLLIFVFCSATPLEFSLAYFGFPFSLYYCYYYYFIDSEGSTLITPSK